MKSVFIHLSLYCISFLFSQKSIESEEIRNIRLNNFKDTYVGKTIQFSGPSGLLTEGVLTGLSSKNLIVLIESDKVKFDHSEINHIYIMPKKAEFLLASSLALVGATVSYLTLLVLRENVGHQQKASFTCLGFTLGGLLGKRTFYKPLKIDISGKVYD